MFLRFIDDLFMIWTSSEQQLIDFMLETTIYWKQTDRQNYVDSQSEHPKLLKDSIPYNQAFQIKRIYSSQQEVVSHTTKMVKEFHKGGYNRSLIEQQIDKANLQEREQLLKEQKKDSAATVPLLLKNKSIKHQYLLYINTNLAEIFQNPPNLETLLVSN